MAHCCVCGKELTKDTKKIISQKSYCQSCYEARKADTTNNDYKELISLICEYFEIDQPTGKILSQIKSYVTNNNFTYTGISYTLWYIKHILNERLSVKYGIYMVKDEYKNAEQFYLKQNETAEKASTYVEKEKRVLFKSNPKKQNLLIDLDKLVKGNV